MEWYEIPVKVQRDDKIMIVPANEVKRGDYVFYLGMKRKCDGHIPDDDEEVMYLEFGINSYPAEMFDSE